MYDFFEKFFGDMNKKGIPLPLFRDNKTGAGSITFTLFAVSGILCTGCSLMAIACALTKAAGVFTSFTESQQAIQNAFGISFQFFLACGGFYLGRKMQRDPKGQINVEAEEKADGKEQG